MIVKMLKTKIFLLENERFNVLESLQKSAIIMFDDKHINTSNEHNEENNLLMRTIKIINILEKHQKKKKYFSSPQVDDEQFMTLNENVLKFLDECENLFQRKNDLLICLQKKIEILKEHSAFQNLKIPTDIIQNSIYVDYLFGYINSDKIDLLIDKSQDNSLFAYQLFETVKDQRAIALVYEKNNYHIVKQILDEVTFRTVSLPITELNFSEYLQKTEQEMIECNLQIKELENSLDDYSQNLFNLKLFADQILNLKIRKSVVFEKTESSVYVEGWIKERDQERFEKYLKESATVYEIEYHEPHQDDKVPTATNNGKIIKPFESITNMYSVPNYQEIDPNPLMSVWYLLFFGIMMGDIGYGFLLVFVLGYFLKFKKVNNEMRKLMTVFFYGGIVSIIFGIIFGSLFGKDFGAISLIGKIFGQTWPDSLMNPVADPLQLLIVSVAAGAFHLISGLLMKVINSVKRKEINEIVLACGWIFVLVGAMVIALGMASIIASSLIGFIISGLGITMVFVSSFNKGKGIRGKIMAGLGGVYGISGYLSDLLSYSRLLALSLSTAIIAFTMNTLAEMLQGNLFGFIVSVLIYLIGHVFNFIMGLLSVYVHAGRLQYIEFFGKFYEGEGYEFKPFSLELNYINIIERRN